MRNYILALSWTTLPHLTSPCILLPIRSKVWESILAKIHGGGRSLPNITQIGGRGQEQQYLVPLHMRWMASKETPTS